MSCPLMSPEESILFHVLPNQAQNRLHLQPNPATSPSLEQPLYGLDSHSDLPLPASLSPVYM